MFAFRGIYSLHPRANCSPLSPCLQQHNAVRSRVVREVLIRKKKLRHFRLETLFGGTEKNFTWGILCTVDCYSSARFHLFSPHAAVEAGDPMVVEVEAVVGGAPAVVQVPVPVVRAQAVVGPVLAPALAVLAVAVPAQAVVVVAPHISFPPDSGRALSLSPGVQPLRKAE